MQVLDMSEKSPGHKATRASAIQSVYPSSHFRLWKYEEHDVD